MKYINSLGARVLSTVSRKRLGDMAASILQAFLIFNRWYGIRIGMVRSVFIFFFYFFFFLFRQRGVVFFPHKFVATIEEKKGARDFPV